MQLWKPSEPEHSVMGPMLENEAAEWRRERQEERRRKAQDSHEYWEGKGVFEIDEATMKSVNAKLAEAQATAESLLRENASLIKKLQEAQAIAVNMLQKCRPGEPPDKALEAKACTWIVEMLDA